VTSPIASGKAHLLNTLNQEMVVFDYNPTEIGIAHDADIGTMYVRPDKPTSSTGAALTAFQSLGSTRLQFSQLIFVGRKCRDEVEKLRKWVQPSVPAKSAATSSVLTKGGGGADGKPQLTRPPLQFIWGTKGDGFDFKVELMRFDCSYTRFSEQGVPIRAEVRNLTLHIVEDTQLAPGFARDLPAGPTGRPAVTDGAARPRLMGDGLRAPAPPRRTPRLMGGAPAPPRRQTGGPR
jgi:hypothetical protein